MNLRKKLKGNKGITLIALVVTIIVLLILAGISIMMLTGQNGILNRANQAKENTGTAQTEELVKLSVTDALTQGLGSLTDANLKTSLNNNVGTGKYEITGDETNGWTVTVDGKEFKVDATGNVAGGNSGETSGVWTANSTNTEFTKGDITLKIGDYVNYSCTDGIDTSTEVEGKTIYTSTSDKNGYGDQKFKLTDYKDGKWQVLGVDEEGCLQLISDREKPTYFHLKGQNGYANGISELDKISSLYGQGKYAKSARSVNVEDINKITGYKDDNYNAGTSYAYQTGNEVTYTLSEDGKVHYQGTKSPTSDTTSQNSSFTYWTGTEWKSLVSGENVTIKHDSYKYYPQTLTTTYGSESTIKNLDGEASTNAYNLLFANTNTKYYWLGSQSYFIYGNFVEFELRRVSDGCVKNVGLYTSGGNPGSDYSVVRSVVTLKSEVQITNGDGSINTPWILGEKITLASGLEIRGETTIEQGATSELTVTQQGGEDEEIEWSSSSENVEVVKKNENTATITGKTIGSATITATAKSSGKTATCSITVKETSHIGQYLEYNVAYTDIYDSSREYTAQNGWRILRMTPNEKETYDVDIISTGVPAGLVYHYDYINESKYSPWAGTEEQITSYTKQYYTSGSDTNNNMYSASGLRYNFKNIVLKQQSGKTTWSKAQYNTGYYTKISKNGETKTGDITGERFIAREGATVRSVMHSDITGNEYSSSISVLDPTNATGLFILENIGYTTGAYFLASPSMSGYEGLYYVGYKGGVGDSRSYYSYSGLRPVVSISGVHVQKKAGSTDVWEITN